MLLFIQQTPEVLEAISEEKTPDIHVLKIRPFLHFDIGHFARRFFSSFFIRHFDIILRPFGID